MSLMQFIRRGDGGDGGEQATRRQGSSPVQIVSPTANAAPRVGSDWRSGGDDSRPKQIRRREELPRSESVLTGAGGCAEVSEEDQRAVAVLDVGSREAVVVWTGDDRHASAKRYAQRRVIESGYTIRADRYIAPADVIQVLHSHGATVGQSGTKAAPAATDHLPRSESEMEGRFKDLVAKAVQAGASDIHIRIRKGRPTDVMYRVNGRLQLVVQMPEEIGFDMARAIHRMGGIGKTGIDLDVRQPQDASVEVTVDVEKSDGTVATVETNLRFGSVPERTGGANIVLRIIVTNNAEQNRTLEELGYSAKQQAVFRQAISEPDGLTILVGTTGSGKSKTLQTNLSMVYELFGESKAINTIEQPVEYVITGATQSPVPKESAKDTSGFASMLRALMRGDPDVIMVGEIRDKETAHTTQDAVQTGHPVYTTLHSKNCIEAAVRLMSLGMEREVVTSLGFLNVVAYQRLAEEVCQECALSYAEADERGLVERGLRERLLKRVGGQAMRQTRYEHPEGCEKCNFTGVGGRTVCAEFFVPHPEELELLAAGRVTDAQMRWRARAAEDPDGVQGWRAQDHAIWKMCEGRLSPVHVDSAFGQIGSGVTPEQALAWVNDRLRRPKGG